MKKVIILLILIAIGVVGYFVGYPFFRAYSVKEQASNIETVDVGYLTIPEGTHFNELGALLEENKIIDNADDFNFLVDFKKKDRVINVDKIRVEKDKWQNYNSILNNIVTQLNANTNVIYVQYNNAKSIADIAGKLTTEIDLDSADFADYLSDPETMASIGFNEQTYSTFFIPVKFEVYQDITKEELFTKLKDYYKTFWNDDRKAKAAEIGLSQSEVTILASIVYEEQKVKFDEQPAIAGLYLNRLKKGWLLQADPTVKYALGDPSIKRLLYKHLEVESPYNTYKHKGLPPGAISFPESQTIDAVLDHEKHDFMYMCAKPEYSGYHNFSETLSQHNVYAKSYQKWLNSEGIK
jgi:UPF0755 protein